ncbi:MAG: response regulator [Betaproteobacteria bacterium]|nr:response regulator [Betaproteobacteria bacterium]
MSPKKKILVIDDDEAVLSYLQQTLGPLYDVVATTEPGLAVDLALRLEPDLILCDIDMPDVNGGELSCRFFACEDTREIPFAYLTSFVLPEEVCAPHGNIVVRRSIAKATPASEMIRMIEQMLH